jgi:hypothetical protein
LARDAGLAALRFDQLIERDSKFYFGLPAILSGPQRSAGFRCQAALIVRDLESLLGLFHPLVKLPPCGLDFLRRCRERLGRLLRGGLLALSAGGRRGGAVDRSQQLDVAVNAIGVEAENVEKRGDPDRAGAAPVTAHNTLE